MDLAVEHLVAVAGESHGPVVLGIKGIMFSSRKWSFCVCRYI